MVSEKKCMNDWVTHACFTVALIKNIANDVFFYLEFYFGKRHPVHVDICDIYYTIKSLPVAFNPLNGVLLIWLMALTKTICTLFSFVFHHAVLTTRPSFIVKYRVAMYLLCQNLWCNYINLLKGPGCQRRLSPAFIRQPIEYKHWFVDEPWPSWIILLLKSSLFISPTKHPQTVNGKYIKLNIFPFKKVLPVSS